MADAAWETPPGDEPFLGRVFGDGLRWDSPLEDAWLAVELPFWLMVNSSPLEVTCEGWTTQVQIRGDHVELHVDEYRDSKTSCVYLGPDPSKVNPSVVPDDAAVVIRKCKTVLRLPTRCLTDAIAAMDEGYWRAREAMAYSPRSALDTSPSSTKSLSGTGSPRTTSSRSRSVRGTCPCGSCRRPKAT